MKWYLIALCSLGLAASAARADEGMWTYNLFPKQKVKERHGFAPDDAWLEHARLSSARLARGCSGSFVSPQGLVMTNHHCVHDCVEKLSTPQRDLSEHGFLAAGAADELRCPAMEINQLVAIDDVSDRIFQAANGLEDARYNTAIKAEIAVVEKECATSDEVRCDVVTLYQGGAYHLYKYRRYQDVRLAFAPEFTAAFFGGDPENFTFPRYDYDVSFVRVYEGGKPARTEHYFAWSQGGAKDGELTFVSGHPGKTERLLTMAQLEHLRDLLTVPYLLRLAELRGVLTEFQRRGPEAKRMSTSELFGIENSYKAGRGRLLALLSPEVMTSKRAAEKSLRARVGEDAERQRKYGKAWDLIAGALAEHRRIYKRHYYLESGWGYGGDLFRHARDLLRAADELPKRNDKRLTEFRESQLPLLKQKLFTAYPIDPDLEIVELTYGLTKLREEFGAADPFVKKVLGEQSPEEVATRLVKGSKLRDAAVRKALWDGGKPALARAKDPMIEFARLVDGDARAIRKQYEDKVEAPIKKGSELIARARFELEGTASYPDATFSLRLSFGEVKGYQEGGRAVKPFTNLGGGFALATGRDPYRLPESWLRARSRLKLTTPLNFVTTNDIIGGNSGSPVINQKGEIVGLVFDGNIQSLGGAFYYDEAINRTVAVHSEAILYVLEHVYGAERLVREIRP